MRIFLDANVLFSAGNSGSNITAFLYYLRKNHALFMSDYVYAEAERNILLKRPLWKRSFTQ